MSGWVIAVAIVFAIALILVLLPIRLRFNFQGRGDPSGVWAIAGGAQIGPAVGSGVAARGIETTIQAHLFGRSIYKRTLKELRAERDKVREESDSIEPVIEKLEARYKKLERWFDPLDLALFLLRERRRVVFERVIVDLDYSFADITVTGKLLGAIYAFSALLPAQIVIRQNPRWEFVDKLAVAGSGKIRIWPGLLVVDAAWFLIRNVRVRRRPPEATEST